MAETDPNINPELETSLSSEPFDSFGFGLRNCSKKTLTLIEKMYKKDYFLFPPDLTPEILKSQIYIRSRDEKIQKQKEEQEEQEKRLLNLPKKPSQPPFFKSKRKKESEEALLKKNEQQKNKRKMAFDLIITKAGEEYRCFAKSDNFRVLLKMIIRIISHRQVIDLGNMENLEITDTQMRLFESKFYLIPLFKKEEPQILNNGYYDKSSFKHDGKQYRSEVVMNNEDKATYYFRFNVNSSVIYFEIPIEEIEQSFVEMLNTTNACFKIDKDPHINEQIPLFESDLLRKHQVDGVNFLLKNWKEKNGSLLADEIGLGKSAQVISFLSHIQKNSNWNGPFLFVVHRRDKEFWGDEIRKWSNMQYLVYPEETSQSGFTRSYRFPGRKPDGTVVPDSYSFNILIMSYQDFTRDFPRIESFEWQILVIDNPICLMKQANDKKGIIKNLSAAKSLNKIIIHDIVVESDMQYLSYLLSFINNTIQWNTNQFSSSYVESMVNRQIIMQKALIRKALLRRTYDTVFEKNSYYEEKVVFIKPTTIQKDFLEMTAKNTLAANLGLRSAVTYDTARQICIHPVLLDEARKYIQQNYSLPEEDITLYSSSKFIALYHILKESIKQNKKCIVYSCRGGILLQSISLICNQANLSCATIINNRANSTDKITDSKKRFEKCKMFIEGKYQIILTNVILRHDEIKLADFDVFINLDPTSNPHWSFKPSNNLFVDEPKLTQVYRLILYETIEHDDFLKSRKIIDKWNFMFSQSEIYQDSSDKGITVPCPPEVSTNFQKTSISEISTIIDLDNKTVFQIQSSPYFLIEAPVITPPTPTPTPPTPPQVVTPVSNAEQIKARPRFSSKTSSSTAGKTPFVEQKEPEEEAESEKMITRRRGRRKNNQEEEEYTPVVATSKMPPIKPTTPSGKGASHMRGSKALPGNVGGKMVSMLEQTTNKETPPEHAENQLLSSSSDDEGILTTQLPPPKQRVIIHPRSTITQTSSQCQPITSDEIPSLINLLKEYGYGNWYQISHFTDPNHSIDQVYFFSSCLVIYCLRKIPVYSVSKYPILISKIVDISYLITFENLVKSKKVPDYMYDTYALIQEYEKNEKAEIDAENIIAILEMKYVFLNYVRRIGKEFPLHQLSPSRNSPNDHIIFETLNNNQDFNPQDERVIEAVNLMKYYLIIYMDYPNTSYYTWWSPDEVTRILNLFRKYGFDFSNEKIFHARTGIMSKTTEEIIRFAQSLAVCVQLRVQISPEMANWETLPAAHRRLKWQFAMDLNDCYTIVANNCLYQGVTKIWMNYEFISEELLGCDVEEAKKAFRLILIFGVDMISSLLEDPRYDFNDRARLSQMLSPEQFTSKIIDVSFKLPLKNGFSIPSSNLPLTIDYLPPKLE